MKNSLMKYAVWSMLLFVTMQISPTAQAQCAMCSLNAENSAQEDGSIGKGLNDGIYFLLAMPFLIGGGVGFLWYKRFRNPETKSSLL